MNRVLLVLILSLLLAHSSAAREWRLVWSDEFDYTGLPNKSKWDYEHGFVRNRELQYYTRARRENAWVADGVLTITARKERLANPRYRPDSPDWRRARQFAEYSSAAIITRHKSNWKYGRIEVRAKLPKGKGMWPAIWMLGANRDETGWPGCGEIDIMEFIGKDPDTIYGTVHFRMNGKHRSDGGRIDDRAPSDDFHVYAIEWDAKQIEFFFDDKCYHNFEIDQAGVGPENPFRQPYYLLINLALGGSWGGPVDDEFLPQEYLIDYVRVHEGVER